MAAPAKKSNTGKLVFVVVALVLASTSIAWQFGVFGGSNSTKPDPNAPPAVVEDAEEKAEREQIEDAIKSYNDANGDAPAGS